MSRKLDDLMAAMPVKRRAKINDRAMELATLKDLRKAAEQTQEELAAALGVGQDTISRLEKRSDMLLSTLRHYVESMGGRLELVAQFPNRPPVVINHLGVERSSMPRSTDRPSTDRSSTDRPSRTRSRSARTCA
jgi:DNA-binding XRE family transcriptional regulator